MIAKTTRNFLSDTHGAVLVETAFVLPVLLLFALGSLLWALTLWQQITIQQAVEMEARCAVLPNVIQNVANPYCGFFNCNAGSSTLDAQTCAVKQAFGMSVSPSKFSVPTISVPGPASFCTNMVNYGNPFTLSLVPLPTQLNAQYCRYSQY